MTPAEDRYAGCLVGQCVGDAVGFPVEGSSAAICRAHADAVLLQGAIPDAARGGFPFGQISDDSQLARELALSMAERHRFDPADYAGRIRDMFASGRIVGGGWATAQAAAKLAEGAAWTVSGTPPPNAGNGSAMRAAPVGLAFFDDPDALIAVACDQGRITHADPRCSAGAVAIAGAVALAVALDERRWETSAVVAVLATWANRVDRRVGDAVTALPAILPLPPHEALVAIEAVAEPDVSPTGTGVSPFVTTSVVWSLYAFLRSPDDFRQCLHTAIAIGGDVDTTGAMTGAMAGARNGLAAIPRPLAERIEDRGAWRLNDWLDLAGRLSRHCVRPAEGSHWR
ncbi:MAG: ADP-ribosylglycohydrolase family protein [Rhodospirillales bacterium]|nr:MAG: ADP-ribosylglycohydrolase family protein [Rhodospirillales bacterium]